MLLCVVLFSLLYNIPFYIVICFMVAGYLGCFQFGPINNIAAMNALIHVFWWPSALIYTG